MTLQNVLAQIQRAGMDVRLVLSLTAGDDFIAPIGVYTTTAFPGEPDQSILCDLADGKPFRATPRGWESPSIQLIQRIVPIGLLRRALDRGLISSPLDSAAFFLTSGKPGHVKACLSRRNCTKPIFELIGTSTLNYSKGGSDYED